MDGTIITANANFLATVGIRLTEIKGKHHSMFCDPAYAATAEYREFWAKAQSRRVPGGAVQALRQGRQGDLDRSLLQPAARRGGKPYKVVKYATDISTAEGVERPTWPPRSSAIGRSQAVIEFNLDGTIITANDNFLQPRLHSGRDPGQASQHVRRARLRGERRIQGILGQLGRGELHAGQYKRARQGRARKSGSRLLTTRSSTRTAGPAKWSNTRPTSPSARKNRALGAGLRERRRRALVQEVPSIRRKTWQGTAQSLAARGRADQPAVLDRSHRPSRGAARPRSTRPRADRGIDREWSAPRSTRPGAPRTMVKRTGHTRRRKIGEITQIINDIASQTNLLALNARSKPHAPARPARASPWSPRR